MRSVLLVLSFIFLACNAENGGTPKAFGLQKLVLGQSTITITISEPAIFKLEDLFKQAEIVALVKTLSGDDENYDVAVYKARVLKSFKGANERKTLFYGPYVGEKLGSEYFVFLRKAAKPIVPKPKATGGYGTVEYWELFNEGDSGMMSAYECVFEGAKPSESCGDAVRICTDYIVLPKSIPTFPPAEEDTPFGCRWVRKQAFIQVLEALAWSASVRN